MTEKQRKQEGANGVRGVSVREREREREKTVETKSSFPVDFNLSMG